MTWVSVVVVTTVLLMVFRQDLDKAHIALAYLLVVLVGTARTGRLLGMMLAVLCFTSFNFFLLPPYHTLLVADPRDWIVLLAFLITSFVAAQLFHRAQTEAEEARQRGKEMERFATLGAETLSAGRAEDATQAIAQVLQATLSVGACELFDAQPHGGTYRRLGYASRPGFELSAEQRLEDKFDFALERDVVIVRRMSGTVHALDTESPHAAFAQPDAKVVVVPLRVRNVAVGILQLSDDRPLQLTDAERRFVQALAYYAALGVERVSLIAEAERVEAFQVADRFKDALLAAVSHDLRTPLTTIKALAQQVGREGDERVRTIEVEADRLNRIVTDLLELTRMRAHTLELQPELNAADDLLSAALNQVSGLPRAADIRVEMPPELMVGRFDLLHSVRALVNLLENALKYSPPGTPVDVRVSQAGDRLEFAVLDRGPGVPAHQVAHIFEPFARAGNVAPGASGAGLGLAIARGLAAAQGGAVRYSARPGGGSCFTLSLPAADLPHTALIPS